jgi:FixJ family two-component response regulator
VAQRRRQAAAARALYPELSPKERAVILAAARGAEDKEIAADFRCTLWQRSYKKTHTSSRRRVIAAPWDKACQQNWREKWFTLLV